MPITINANGGKISIGDKEGSGITITGNVQVEKTGDSEIIAGDKVVRDGITLHGDEADKVAKEVRDDVAAVQERLRGLADAIPLGEILGGKVEDPYTRMAREAAESKAAPDTITSQDYVGGIMKHGGASYRMDKSVPAGPNGFTYRKIN